MSYDNEQFMGSRRSTDRTEEARRPSVCYCPNRGDDYHLAGDPGCVSDPRIRPAAPSEGSES